MWRHKLATLTATAALTWAVTAHPAAATLTATVLAGTAAAWKTGSRRWLMRRGEPTDLYTHYFASGEHLYIGISNRYDLRCGQHADDKWWWLYVDPSQSTTQTWPNRAAALRAEEAQIRRHSPIGNRQHNRRYEQQQPRRAALAARAAAHASYGQPPPVITMSTPGRTAAPRVRPGAPARPAEWRPR